MFVKLSPKLIDDIKVQVDNKFILYFMPNAPSDYVKVYLYGLSLISTNSELATKDNSIEKIAKLLSMSESDIIVAFEYWASLGIIHMDKAVYPPIIEYLPTLDTKSTYLKKFNIKKYEEFNTQLAKVVTGRNFLPQELNEYYQIMESLHIEQMGMIVVICHCIRNKGIDIKANYILATARNLASQGIKTLTDIESYFSELKLYNKDLQDVFDALKVHRAYDDTDKDMYKKWTNEYKYPKDLIISVAKKIKRGGMDLLNSKLDKYYKNHLMSLKSIQDYDKNYTDMLTLAKELCKKLGVKYERFDGLIDDYIVGWFAMGCDANGIMLVASMLSKTEQRSFDNLNNEIYKFYKKGLVDEVSILKFVDSTKLADKYILHLLQLLGDERQVTTSDRAKYNLWTSTWHMSHDLIEYGASVSIKAINPLSYLCSILANWHKDNINTVEKAKKTINEKPKTQHIENKNPFVVKNTYERRDMTAQEVNAILESLTYDDL